MYDLLWENGQMVSSIKAERVALKGLCKEFRVKKLEIFGSAATDQEIADTSDLDFLVEFDRDSSLALADQYFGLLQALEDLFGRQVDLLTSRSLKNPYFIRSVEQSRRLLYAA